MTRSMGGRDDLCGGDRQKRRPRTLIALACASTAFLTVQYASTSRLHEYVVNDDAGGTGIDVESHRTLIMMSSSEEETHVEDGELLPAIPKEEATYDSRTIPHPRSIRGGDKGEVVSESVQQQQQSLMEDVVLLRVNDNYSIPSNNNGDGINTVNNILLKTQVTAMTNDGDDHAAEEHEDEDEDEDEDTGIMTHSRLIGKSLPLPPYDIEDAIRTSRMYENTYALLVYDPEKDAFYMLYSKRHYFVQGVYKLINSFGRLTNLLRRIFPERFQGVKSDELVIPISSGDYPAVKNQCLDHFRGKGKKQTWRDLMASKAKATCGDGNPAPILHFGSVFRQPHMFPNMIGMPMPSPEHLYCMEKWVIHQIVCKELRVHSAADDRGRLVYGEELGLTWENLIPQVIWRGTDFSFLTKVYPTLRKPIFDESLIKWPWQEQDEDDQKTNKIFGRMTAYKADILKKRLDRVRKRAPRRADDNINRLRQFDKAAAVKAMREQYDDLLPRWKAVVLTGEAEVDAAAFAAAGPTDEGSLMFLPWANMKFSNFVEDGSKTGTEGSDPYKDWENIGFPATGEYLPLTELAKYKYHIDLGGGGGTTWTGTIQKLALPGLLFHHMTPTMDYIHDYLVPWKHYIPVSADLRDLKRKYDWAESNPVKAAEIAKESTNLIRYLTSPEGYQEIFDRSIVEPLRHVIEAYQPLSLRRRQWRHWREAIRHIEEEDVLVPIYECERSCHPLQGKDWWEKTFTPESKRKRFG